MKGDGRRDMELLGGAIGEEIDGEEGIGWGWLRGREDQEQLFALVLHRDDMDLTDILLA